MLFYEALKSHQANMLKSKSKAQGSSLKVEPRSKPKKTTVNSLNEINKKLFNNTEKAKSSQSNIISLSNKNRMQQLGNEEKADMKKRMEIKIEIEKFQDYHRKFNEKMKAYIDVCLNHENNMVCMSDQKTLFKSWHN
jgi:hypothetical protein